MSDIKALAEKLRLQLARDSPEEIIKGLYRLVLTQEDFKSPELYRSIMKVMADALSAKL